LIKHNQHFTSLPLPILNLKDSPIRKVITKGNTCYALAQDGSAYCWGDLNYGLGLQQAVQ